MEVLPVLPPELRPLVPLDGSASPPDPLDRTPESLPSRRALTGTTG